MKSNWICFTVFLLCSCSYRVSSSPKLNRDFNKAVKKLPKVYSPEYKSRFYTLIDVFGTHYITKVSNNRLLRRSGHKGLNGLNGFIMLFQVKLGGQIQSVTSIANCEASLQGLKTEEIQMCLEAEASASVKVSVKAETKHCQASADKLDSKKSSPTPSATGTAH
uniref:PERF n=1 Tax=Poeciliopsis prolifica TaxID=188132 RepID=A0A0S7ETT0_9TELE